MADAAEGFGEMRYFIRVAGIIITLVVLLAVVGGLAQAGHATPVPVGDAERAGDMALVCLALVGGTALLAGGVWVGKLRRMLS